MARLVQENGPAAGTAYPVPGQLTLGRLSDNDVVLNSEGVSRHHARIYRSGGDWFVTDLESRNGTILNGVKAGNERLRPGDRIEVGGFSFVFEVDPPSAVATPAPARPAAPPTPPPRPAGPPVAPRPAGAAAAAGPAIATRDRGSRRQGILQYSEYRDRKPRGGLLGEEVAQWSLGPRLLLYLLLLAVSAGVLYGGYVLSLKLFASEGEAAAPAEGAPR